MFDVIGNELHDYFRNLEYQYLCHVCVIRFGLSIRVLMFSNRALATHKVKIVLGSTSFWYAVLTRPCVGYEKTRVFGQRGSI